MSIDMSQFFGVFFEESQEHLEEMEHLLMSISLDDPDPEDLNSIFRAAHSIKGGSGVFGFDALTGLTHVMENILDLARKDELAITKVIVDQLLITVDTLKNILKSYQNEDDIDWAAIEKGTVQLEALLKTEGGSEQSLTSEDESGFGFFDVPVQDDDDSFGFFDPLDANDESEEEGFGLFAESEDVDDDSFGFFDDEPTKIPAASTLESQENENFCNNFYF